MSSTSDLKLQFYHQSLLKLVIYFYYKVVPEIQSKIKLLLKTKETK